MLELKAEGWSLCTMELEPSGEAVKLTVSIRSTAVGPHRPGRWRLAKNPSDLKSLLETGSIALPQADG
jgi:hypothetical protein